MIDGRARVRSALRELLPAEHTPDPFTLTELLQLELGAYAELIVGPGGSSIGFLVRGDGRTFTERVRISLEILGMPDEARARHLEMAAWFEHQRGFFKAEWHLDGDRVEPRAAVYFLRRPPVDQLLERLGGWGVARAVRDQASALAAILDKRTVHFVAAAFRPGQAIHDKIYLTQWVDDATRAAVRARLAEAFAAFGFDAAARARGLAALDEALVGPPQTLWVSMTGSAAGVSPSLKLDVPGVELADVARWVPADQRAAVVEEARRAMVLAGAPQLTYLGARFVVGQLAPSLKYYCDVPGSR